MSAERGEPRVQARPTPVEERLNGLFERVESLLTLVVSVFLIGFVLVALVGVGVQVYAPIFVAHDYTDAAIRGIDAVFLAIILLELLHTTLSRGPVSRQLQEFLVIGVTATVRHSLEIAAGREGTPRDLVVNLTINAAGALILVAALWLVRQQLRADRRAQAGAGGESGRDSRVGDAGDAGRAGSAATGTRGDDRWAGADLHTPPPEPMREIVSDCQA